MHLINIIIKDQDSFQNFNLEFKEGINIIVGTNGCGKSNILKIINEINQDNKNIKKIYKFNDEESQIITTTIVLQILKFLGQSNIIVENHENFIEYFIKNYPIIKFYKNDKGYTIIICDKNKKCEQLIRLYDNNIFIRYFNLTELNSRIILDDINIQKNDSFSYLTQSLHSSIYHYFNDKNIRVDDSYLNTIINCLINDDYINSGNKMRSLIKKFKREEIYKKLKKKYGIKYFENNLDVKILYRYQNNSAFIQEDSKKYNSKIENIITFFRNIGLNITSCNFAGFNAELHNILTYFNNKSTYYINGIMSNNDFDKYIKFTMNVMNYNSHNNNTNTFSNHIINKYVYNYISNKIPNINNLTNNQHMSINEFFSENSIQYIHNLLLYYKKHKMDLWNNIQHDFRSITGKNFDIRINDFIICKEYIKNILNNGNILIKNNLSLIDQIYNESKEDQKYTFNSELVLADKGYKLSYGEQELISFLSLYYNDSKSILLVDEPCSHLCSQYKIKFRNMFMEQKDNLCKQIIFVTHNSELISENNCRHIIKFSLDNNITKWYSIKNYNENNLKTLYESKEVLFSDKCLLVEGYHDYRLMKEILKYVNLDAIYNIIMMDGCGSFLYDILYELNIDFKIIFDSDILTNRFKDKNDKTKINIKNNIDKLGHLSNKFLSKEFIMINKNDAVYINIINTITDIINKYKYSANITNVHFDEKNNIFCSLNDHSMYLVKLFVDFICSKINMNFVLDISKYPEKFKYNRNCIELINIRKNIFELTNLEIKYIDCEQYIKDKNQCIDEDDLTNFFSALREFTIKNKKNTNDTNILNEGNIYQHILDSINMHNVDELIDYISKNTKVYIWPINIYDIEGFAKNINIKVGSNKKGWYKYSSKCLCEEIQKNINQSPLIELVNFLK